MSRVFITGATGCIGQYVVEALLRNTAHELMLAVRDPARVPASWHAQRRVHLVVGDLRETRRFENAAKESDSAILLAASWGGSDGDEAHGVNVGATAALLRRFDRVRCRRVIYFSTASILDTDSQLLSEADTLGTPYIRSKYHMRRILDEQDGFPTLVILYPTLVLGGDSTHPLSHVSKTLGEIVRHRRWLRWFSGDASFHVIHAADIAQIVCALVEAAGASRDYVLGQPRVTLDESIDAILAHADSARVARIPLTRPVTSALINLFRIRLAPWDRYCLERRHFTYRDAVGPSQFGLTPIFANLRSALSASFPGASAS